MATLTVNLSAALQSTLGQSGVYAWAVPFYTEPNASSSTMSTPVALVDNGVIQDSGTIEIDLGSSFPAGKVYFIIQSVDPGASEPIAPLTFGTGGAIENEADINWDSADTYDFRYDSFEVTISGSAGDDGNLTDVVSFGIPMSVEVEYPNGAPTQTRGYAVNGSSIFDDISDIEPQAVYTYTQGPLAGLHRMAAAPATALTTPGIVGPTASDWYAYVESLGAQAASEVRIAGFFNGAPSVEYTTYNNTTYSYNEYHNPGFYSYRLKWVPGTGTAGTYVFTPEANSQIQGTISITSADLANSIYSTLGNATVEAPDGTQYQFSTSNGTSSPEMNTGANNQWGAFFVQLLTGFTGGYLGGTTTPLTSLLGTGSVSLSHNWNFDPTFAFGGSIVSGPGAVTPWSWNTTTYGSGVPYDAYAGVFFNSSNSYGNQYSDSLMSLFQQGGPLIPVGYSTSGGGQANVPNINLTLYDDNEAAAPGQTLAQTQQYTSPVIYDVSAGPYVTPLTGDGSGTNPTPLSLILDFQLGQMRLDPDATVKFGFYTGQQNGLAEFQYVEIPSSDPGGLFQTWIYQDGSFIAGGGASPTGAILQINNLPYATGINWYQIVISRGGVSRTYDFWADADASAGLLNPNYGSADQSDALAIDNLAQVVTAALPSATEQYATSINIAPFNGGTLSMDPWLLQLVTDASIITANPGTWLTPNAPVLGTLSESIFTNWGGSEQAAAPNSATSLGDVTTGSLAFGWWGSDQNWIGYNASIGNTNVVGSYTNKVSGLDIAKITFTDAAHNPITARADIDGKWVTDVSNFSNGTYQAVMTEYHFSLDAKTWVQVANPSQTLQFTVDLSELDFINTGGGFIQLGGDGDTAGNWIRLETLGSTMPNGTLLVYATDTSGNLIGRDGETGAGVTLDDAVLARIGAVKSDGGALLFNGMQSVYLEVGQQLHFAVQTGDGHIQQLPDVLVTGGQSLSVSVTGDFGTLNLSAAVDNTLSASSTAAESQRETDEPWIYLTQGERTHVDVVGSAFNINTIHFVRIDVDPATLDWSVDGVAYGDTQAFRSAVMANWDPGFQATGGRGNFSDGFDWTVSTGSGYYAPVLVTEAGDVFVIGKANADGMDHIRMFGENIFGFEDLRADQRSDFDYNDLVMHLSVL